MKKKERHLRRKCTQALALTLAAVLLISGIQLPVSAEETGEKEAAAEVQTIETAATGLCEHHPEHTGDCGYVEAEPGVDCSHVHSEDCYEEPEVSGNDPVPVCAHSQGRHEDCGYKDAVAGSDCTFVCEECKVKEEPAGGEAAGEETPEDTVSENTVSQNAVMPMRRMAEGTREGIPEIEISDADGTITREEVNRILDEKNLLRSDKFTARIREGVTTIGDKAFQDCRALTSISLPDSVTTIGNSAFHYCAGLTSITLPDSVTTIGNSAFQDCRALTSITLPDSVTTIGDFAFYYCMGLTSITLPDSVTIGNYAFSDCTGLTSITLPDSVTIGSDVFLNCTKLETVTLGGNSLSITGLKTIVANATEIIFPKGTTVTLQEDLTIKEGQTYTISQGATLVIPDGITLTNKGTITNNGTLTGSGTITPKLVPTNKDFTYTVPESNLIYDGQPKTAAVTGRHSGMGAITVKYKQIKDAAGNQVTEANATTTSPTDAGTYQVLVSVAGGNFYQAGTDIEVGEFTITPSPQAALTITGQPGGSIVYGQEFTLGTSGGSGDGAVSWAVTGGNAAVDSSTGEVNVTGVGDVTITATKAGGTNYNDAAATYTFTSGKRAITLTADSFTVVKGAAMPTLTYKTTSGSLVNGDSFTTAPTLTVDAADTDTVGEYDITIKDGELTNEEKYEITYVNGKLTVTNQTAGGGNNGGSNNGSGNTTPVKPAEPEKPVVPPVIPLNPVLPEVEPVNPFHPFKPLPPTKPDTAADEEEPFIKGDGGNGNTGTGSGWTVITDQTEAAKDGDKITVDMNGATTVPGNVIESIAGKDVTVVFDMGEGILWTVNGLSVTADSIADINFSVARNTKNIPIDVINNVTGERYAMTISLEYDGEFGFTAVLTVNMEKKNAGLYANLFYYNPDAEAEDTSDAADTDVQDVEARGVLEFMCADIIDADGNADLEFTHASDYTIVIDETSMDPELVADGDTEDGSDAASADADAADGAFTETGADAADSTGISGGNLWVVTAIIVILALAGIAGYVYFMSRKNEDND